MSTNINPLVEALLAAGVTVWYPYYSGTFDSEGDFSFAQCVRDVSTLVELLTKPVVTEAYFGKELRLTVPTRTVAIGMSYGASVVAHAVTNSFDKVVLLSPALVFNSEDIGGEEGIAFSEQMRHLLGLLQKAHPFTYRISHQSDLRDFLLGNAHEGRREDVIKKLESLKRPALVMHGRNDASIPARVSQSLEEHLNNPNLRWEYIDAGHSVANYPDHALREIADFVTQQI